MTSDPAPACRIAVVIPCHDDGATLREAVESIDEAEPLELAVVDDGSTDGATLAELERLARQGVRVVRREQGGLPVARMTGVAATTAPYVYALDADDLASGGVLARLADALDREPRAAVAWGDERTFGTIEVFKRSAPSLDPWRITYLNEIPTSALVRRSALEDAGGWMLQGGYEDWDLWMALAERGWQGVYLPGLVTRHYRQHGPRMLGDSTTRHAALYGEMRRRHPSLFARRRENWRSSTAPWRLKLLLPVVTRLPLLSEFDRQRLVHLVSDPVRLLRVRLERARGRRRGEA